MPRDVPAVIHGSDLPPDRITKELRPPPIKKVGRGSIPSGHRTTEGIAIDRISLELVEIYGAGDLVTFYYKRFRIGRERVY